MFCCAAADRPKIGTRLSLNFMPFFTPGTGWRYVVPFDPNWISAFFLLFLGIAIGVIALKH
jgi:hypothetical protein